MVELTLCILPDKAELFKGLFKCYLEVKIK